MINNLKIAIAQINPTLGDLEGNAAKILQFWQDAEDKGADLVVFPELVLCGYPPQDLVIKRVFLDAVQKKLSEICVMTKGFKSAALIGAQVATHTPKPFNAVHLIEHGSIQATRHKHHLPNYGVFDEKRVFTAGDLPEPIEFRGAQLGVMICEDMWYSDVGQHLKKKGAQILIVPNASPFHQNKDDIRLLHARARVNETKLPLVCAHMIGGQDDLVFDGGSCFIDEKGNITAHTPFFEETLLFGNDETSEIPDVNALTYEALKTGLRDYVNKNGFSGVLLGLSGGIDSALVAALAVDALGASRVTCVMLPSKYTSKHSVQDAAQLADNLNVDLQTISIKNTVKALNKTIPKDSPSIAFENIQSRARGVILMALSNATGDMLLTTGNKSEMACGYATLYGDMCGGFNPLKDLYKTEVYALSKWRNDQEGYDLIPKRILTKAPTAELKDNQTDQDSLPPYDVLDDILKGYIEDDLGIADLITKGFDEETCKRVWNMLHRAEYKRRQAAPGPKITSRAFYNDRRYPMTNGFKA